MESVEVDEVIVDLLKLYLPRWEANALVIPRLIFCSVHKGCWCFVCVLKELMWFVELSL